MNENTEETGKNMLTVLAPTEFQNINKTEKKFGKTSIMIDGFCFVITAAGLDRSNTGKDDGKGDDDNGKHWAICRLIKTESEKLEL
jgi:hypothetical protein